MQYAGLITKGSTDQDIRLDWSNRPSLAQPTLTIPQSRRRNYLFERQSTARSQSEQSHLHLHSVAPTWDQQQHCHHTTDRTLRECRNWQLCHSTELDRKESTRSLNAEQTSWWDHPFHENETASTRKRIQAHDTRLQRREWRPSNCESSQVLLQRNANNAERWEHREQTKPDAHLKAPEGA